MSIKSTFYEEKRVFVTSGYGFIGLYLVEKLLDLNCDV